MVELGADPDAAQNNGATSIHVAAQNGHVVSMRHLTRLGADVNKVDGNGRTALMLCVGRSTAEVIVRCLLEAGADRWIKDREGRTAREHAKAKTRVKVVALLDTYWPITPEMTQLLLGMKGPTESPLTRFAAHELFEPAVLSLVKCFVTGEDRGAFSQLLDDE